jgi:ABC-type transport system substrate-binding protein
MGDAAVFVEGDSVPGLGGALVVESTDPAKTRASIGKIKGLLSQFNQRPGPAPAGATAGFSLRTGAKGKPIQIGLVGSRFVIAYGNAAVQGVTYQDLGLKIQSDVARVGIKVNLRPVDQVNLRTEYTTGKSKGGVLTFWNPPAVENQLWAAAVVQRVAKRVHWNPPEDIVKLVSQAATEADPKKQADLWVEWQKKVVDQANHFILFQPVYQIAVRNTVKDFPLTAAGWMLDLHGVTPAG